MRQLLLVTLLFFAGCSGIKNTATQVNILNGTWLPIAQQIGGTELPATAFEKQKLIIKDSNYTLFAESVDKGIARYKDGKMDIYGKEGVNTGKHFTAIYNYQNNQLTICYNLTGTNYPEAFDTKGKPLYFLAVFKKRVNNSLLKVHTYINAQQFGCTMYPNVQECDASMLPLVQLPGTLICLFTYSII